MDFKVDESSDAPMLDERSPSPSDCPPDAWLVDADIDNIER